MEIKTLKKMIGEVQEGETRQHFDNINEMLSCIKSNLEKFYSLTIWNLIYTDEELAYIENYLKKENIPYANLLNGLWCFKNTKDLEFFLKLEK